MPVKHLIRRDSVSKRQDLMSDADSKNRIVIGQDFLSNINSAIKRVWVTRTIRKEESIWIKGFHLFIGCIKRKHFYITVSFGEISQDVLLDTQI
ncbi:hypothetical protein D9M69_655030 [compost metagenome]